MEKSQEEKDPRLFIFRYSLRAGIDDYVQAPSKSLSFPLQVKNLTFLSVHKLKKITMTIINKYIYKYDQYRQLSSDTDYFNNILYLLRRTHRLFKSWALGNSGTENRISDVF